MKFRLSNHAREEMERRKIPLALVESVLDNPQQVVVVKGGKKAYQSQIDFVMVEFSCCVLSWRTMLILRLWSPSIEQVNLRNIGDKYEDHIRP